MQYFSRKNGAVTYGINDVSAVAVTNTNEFLDIQQIKKSDFVSSIEMLCEPMSKKDWEKNLKSVKDKMGIT